MKRKGEGGKTLAWDHATANLRVPNLPFSYVDREKFALSFLKVPKKVDENGPPAKE